MFCVNLEKLKDLVISNDIMTGNFTQREFELKYK